MVAGNKPSFTSLKQKRLSGVPIAISQQQISPSAPPNAAPCTIAMVGLLKVSSLCRSIANCCASCRFSLSVLVAIDCIQPRSAPAEKCFPCAINTNARRESSRSSCSKVSISEAINSSLNALCFSGRLRLNQATPLLSFSSSSPVM